MIIDTSEKAYRLARQRYDEGRWLWLIRDYIGARHSWDTAIKWQTFAYRLWLTEREQV